jgi:calcineurin-like phosphoesterase family protein
MNRVASLTLNIEDHDNYILNFVRDHVWSTDLIIHIGDFMFGRNPNEIAEVVKQIPCKIEFVKGNHDRLLAKWMKGENRSFIPAEEELRIINGKDTTSITVSHMPMLRWEKSHYGSWCLHGHEHGGLEESKPDYLAKINTLKGKRIDVGVDTSIDYLGYPMWSFSDLEAYMVDKEATPHH